MIPKAIGPYSISRCVEGKKIYFISGQLGIDPNTGQLEDGVENQTRKAMENIKAIVEDLGLGMNNIAKTTIFIVNSEDFAKVNEIYSKYFQEPYPARTTVIVKALPKNALVEIESIAYL